MTEFQIFDARIDALLASDQKVLAASPEAAARLVLGVDLVRSGRKSDLAARVYWDEPGKSKAMVRLYRRAFDRAVS